MHLRCSQRGRSPTFVCRDFKYRCVLPKSVCAVCLDLDLDRDVAQRERELVGEELVAALEQAVEERVGDGRAPALCEGPKVVEAVRGVRVAERGDCAAHGVRRQVDAARAATQELDQSVKVRSRALVAQDQLL